MAQTFEIPGLKDAITNVQTLTDTVSKLSKDLLDAAINAEKVTKAINVDGFKSYIEFQKVSNAENEKVEREKSTR